MRTIALGLILCSTCADLELHADLEGPRVFASSLPRPRNVEVATMPEIFVDFSEAIDPASLRVALVAWEERGSCSFTPVCAAEGTTCERGRCMTSPLTTAAVAKLEEAPPEHAIPLAAPVLTDSPVGPGTRVTITPRRALQAYARHSLLVFARDLSGAPLVDDDGVASVWRRDLVTAGAGSGGPEALLVTPPSGSGEVPPNLAHVATQFARPVEPDPQATLALEAEDGSRVMLVDPTPCAGWVPGLCLRWTAASPVLPDMAYRPAGGTLRDVLGLAAVSPAESTWFVTASAPDLDPPQLADATLITRGPCTYAHLTASEPLQLRLTIGEGSDEAVAGPGSVALALRSRQASATLRAEDLAGNASERLLQQAVPGDSLVEIPALGLAEILANPRGPEPAQEFVEIVDLRGDGPALTHTDLFLADLSAADVATALAASDRPGDALPPFTTRPGERALIVAAAYDPGEGSDVAPIPGTALIRVDASLGAGGLKNAGEPVTLYHAPALGPAVIVASHGNYIATEAPGHAGRSVVADPRACDLARAWASHPDGAASPGAAP
ncbi:MAG TPA: hypothetical protein VGB85_09570 [Nannocystis sp.]|jgi:hypothetical protein